LSTKRVCHLVLGFLSLMCASGCREDNPAYLGRALRDAAVEKNAGVTDAQPDKPAPTPDNAVPVPDAKPETGKPDTPADEKREPDSGPRVDGAVVDVGLDGPGVAVDGPEKVDVLSPDGVDLRGDRPADEPIGRDVNGDRIRRDAGPDEGVDVPLDLPAEEVPVAVDASPTLDAMAVDAAPSCVEGQTIPCASPGNPLVGACQAGTKTCTGGAWTQCSETLPAATDPCNGIDDNCNGAVDEDCTSDCVVVSLDGVDATADGSKEHPFGSVEAALAFVGQVDGGSGRAHVCIAGGTTCDETATYTMASSLAIGDGVTVQGSYALTADGPRYCKDAAKPTTMLKFNPGDGVVFGDGVASGAELSGFVIDWDSSSTATATTTAGVSVSGAKKVSLSRLIIEDGATGATTYGVNVSAGGDARIVGCAIAAGQGRTTALAVSVTDATVELRNNCDGATAGICNGACDDTSVLGIRGAIAAAAAGSSAVAINGAGTFASTLVANLVCGAAGSAEGASGAHVATVRCENGGCANLVGNAIYGGSGHDSVGLAVTGNDPSVQGNLIEGGCGSHTSTGILLDGPEPRMPGGGPTP
jgi:hypothetical protein